MVLEHPPDRLRRGPLLSPRVAGPRPLSPWACVSPPACCRPPPGRAASPEGHGRWGELQWGRWGKGTVDDLDTLEYQRHAGCRHVIGDWSPHQLRDRRMPTVEELSRAAPQAPVFVLSPYSRGFLNRAGSEAEGRALEARCRGETGALQDRGWGRKARTQRGPLALPREHGGDIIRGGETRVRTCEPPG
jgi:hypothetical protein